MRPDPALGDEVHGDAAGQEEDADGEGADDPGELDAALEHEVVEDAEDEDEDGGFGEERRAALGGDHDEIEQRRAGDVGRRCGGHQEQVGGSFGGGSGDLGGAVLDWVKHKEPL